VLAEMEAEKKRIEFWESLREWFQGRGYTLYHPFELVLCHPPTDTDPHNSYTLSDDPEWPFAYFGDVVPDIMNRPPLTAIIWVSSFFHSYYITMWLNLPFRTRSFMLKMVNDDI